MSGALRLEFYAQLYDIQQLFSTCSLIAEQELREELIKGADHLRAIALGQGGAIDPSPAVTRILCSLGTTLEARSFDATSKMFTLEGERGEPLSLALGIIRNHARLTMVITSALLPVK
ncbi:MAG: hypothetical protein JSS61_02090 [Verrucomicrobia bacterium]|nr:hypothetical protein [Verrucomicrobiota bacterium]